MRKLTRRSYNRKLLVFGTSMFMAVAMISTGFAAWVMSSVADANANTPVHVGVVTDASMEVTVDQWVEDAWDGDTLKFDAPEGDLGRVYADKDAKGDHLTLLISGKVTNAQALGTLTITITLPDSLKNAIDAGYLEVVDSDNYSNGVVTYAVSGDSDTLTSVEGEDTSKAFSYTLELAWGDFFGGENPAKFYDSETATRDVEGVPTAGKDIEDFIAEMKEFGKVMHDGVADDTNPYTGTIYILVSATVKA